MKNPICKCLKNNCAEKQSRPLLTLINYQIIQKMFLKRLKKVDFVFLGSTFEQLDFYLKIGLIKENLVKNTIIFYQTRVKHLIQESKPYFVIIGQHRHEKGMHLISSILDYVDRWDNNKNNFL
ncbi:MAG: hypothetical protein IPO94_17620 [Saprospiraceae bacterium]|nr:hypothetical protein [Saprospiraceae bacterium]